jgi:hypothetical protein
MKVPGFVAAQATALDSQVMGLFEFARTDGFHAWIAVTRRRVYKREPADIAFVDITGAPLLTGGADDFADAVTFRDTLILTNGRDPIKRWTGAGNISDLGGSPPRARRIAAFQNRIVLAWIDPHLAAPRAQRLQWSDLGFADVWAAGEAGFLDFIDEPSGILEIMPLRESLVVYKADAIYVMDYTGFPFTMSTRRMATGIGPIGPRVIASMHDVHYFISTNRQIYRLTMAGPEEVGQAVVPALFDELNFRFMGRSFAYVNELESEVNFVVPAGGSNTPNIAYILKHPEGSWGRRDLEATVASPRGMGQLTDITWGTSVGSWDSQTLTWDDTRQTAGVPITVHGDMGGRVYLHSAGQYNADGVAIDGDIQSKMFDFGDPTRKKRLSRLHLHHDIAPGTTLLVSVLAADAPETLPVEYGPYRIVLSGAGDQWIDLDITATFFGFRFRSNTINSPFSVGGYVPTFYVREVT